MKRVIKCSLFLIIGIAIWHVIFKVLWIEGNSINDFYEEPKNSLDIVYIGASNAYMQFNTVLAYHEYGFTTGMLTTGGQSFVAVKYLLEEAQKYQSPKVFVIDMNTVNVDVNYFEEGIIRKITDNMKFSKNKYDLLKELLKYTPVEKSEYIYYYLSFLLYHNSWKDINENKFGNYDYYKGYLLDETMFKSEKFKPFKQIDYVEKLYDDNIDVLNDLINYINEKKLNVIFIVPTRTYAKDHYGRFNYAINMVHESGLKVLNLSEIKEMNIDFSTDLRDEAHLNAYGAIKYTMYLGKYLKDNYNLGDYRNNSGYSSWDKEFERYKKSFDSLSEVKFNDYFEKISG